MKTLSCSGALDSGCMDHQQFCAVLVLPLDAVEMGEHRVLLCVGNSLFPSTCEIRQGGEHLEHVILR
jgi:hypothetical protein